MSQGASSSDDDADARERIAAAAWAGDDNLEAMFRAQCSRRARLFAPALWPIQVGTGGSFLFIIIIIIIIIILN